MDAVDDIFPPYNLSPWEPAHLAAAFPLAPSLPDNDNPPQNDQSIFPPSDNAPDNSLPDPAEISPDLSAALASNFALPNSLPFSLPPHVNQLQNVVTYSQPHPSEHSPHQPHLTDSALSLIQSSQTFDIPTSVPPNDHQNVQLDASSQLSVHDHMHLQPPSIPNPHPPPSRHQNHQQHNQSLHRHITHQKQQQHTHPHQLHQNDRFQMQIQLQQSAPLAQPNHTNPQQPSYISHAKSAAARSPDQNNRLQQPAVQRRQSQSAVQQAARRQSLAQRPIHKQRSQVRQQKQQPHRQPQRQPQRQQKQEQQQSRQKQELHLQQQISQSRQRNSASSIDRRERHSGQQDRTKLTTFRKQASQSHQNLLADINASSAMPGLSSISIPTPTIATGTTITRSPSTTNSTHRSPPETPRSVNRVKSTAVSLAKDRQYEARSRVDKSITDKKYTRPQSTVSNVNKNSQSSTKLNAAMTNPTSGSASAQHTGTVQQTGTGQHSATAPHTSQRISKPRDKHARLRKRLKCSSHDQLVDQLLELVRSATVPEKRIFDTVPRINMEHYVSKCQDLRDSIFSQLPEDVAHGEQPFDANAFRKCKKALSVFRTSVVNMAKTLVEASLWTDVIDFCIAAEGVNKKTPDNRTKGSIRTKLEQFALKAATAMSKPKEAATINPDDHARALRSCQGVFPNVVAKLKGQGSSVLTESQGRSQDFEDPMHSATQLDIEL